MDDLMFFVLSNKIETVYTMESISKKVIISFKTDSDKDNIIYKSYTVYYKLFKLKMYKCKI